MIKLLNYLYGIDDAIIKKIIYCLTALKKLNITDRKVLEEFKELSE